MTTETTPDNVPLNDHFGPLPEPTFHGIRRGGLLREDAWTAAQMRAYAAEQVAAERERCAQIAEPKNDRSDWTEFAEHAARIAARIRRA